jgi:hypothetical protein
MHSKRQLYRLGGGADKAEDEFDLRKMDAES